MYDNKPNNIIYSTLTIRQYINVYDNIYNICINVMMCDINIYVHESAISFGQEYPKVSNNTKPAPYKACV